ncbi:hypothetical protein GSI_00689 [Ganoderma sinense ZZ0214-1]|uniref:Uncharacterized protein n=1 Tax=Ganoderma sinense ZZ0214-1 TaxID=1077348 RepID=A0A2G8ST92_9APHY|nr:hypothetical protein GSI_00689 [Ganoderma sinense ZZ0214-1]
MPAPDRTARSFCQRSSASHSADNDGQAEDLGSDPILTRDHEDVALSNNDIAHNEYEGELSEDEGEAQGGFADEVQTSIANGDVSEAEVDNSESADLDLDPNTRDVQQSSRRPENSENIGEVEVEDDNTPDAGDVSKEGSEVHEGEEETPADDVEIPADHRAARTIFAPFRPP